MHNNVLWHLNVNVLYLTINKQAKQPVLTKTNHETSCNFMCMYSAKHVRWIISNHICIKSFVICAKKINVSTYSDISLARQISKISFLPLLGNKYYTWYVPVMPINTYTALTRLLLM